MKRTKWALVCSALLFAAGPAAAQSTNNPLRLGMLLDLSGPYSDLNGMGSQIGATMAIEDFGGKVLGRPIELLAIDHQNKADLASAKAREWFGKDGVEAILEVVGSSAALAVQEIARDANKVVIMNAPAATRLVNENCSPTSVLYTFNTYAIAQTVGKAVVAQGGRSWFFIAADYAFGAGLVQDTGAVVKAAGGTVLGSAKHPLSASDFAAPLLEAQSSGADVIALANGGADTTNAAKQAGQFGIGRGKQRLVAMVAMITDIHSLGLESAQGLLLTEAFYWDMNEQTRAWSRRFFERMKRMPTMLQAGAYSSTLHYLQAVQAAGTVETGAVMAKMRQMPVQDFFAPNGRIREDGLMVHDMYLFQVKSPQESKGPWDYYKLVATIPGEQAFHPLSESTCRLVKKAQ